MAESAMPHIGGGDGGGESRAPSLVIPKEQIEIAGASGDHEYPPGAKILHKKAKGVKFNRARVVFGELTDRDKTRDYVRGEKNIM